MSQPSPYPAEPLPSLARGPNPRFDDTSRRRRAAEGGDLLRVLTWPSNVRADVIRQFHERGATDMVDPLVLCEEEEWRRERVIEELRALLP